MLSTVVALFVFLYLTLCKPDIHKMKDYTSLTLPSGLLSVLLTPKGL